VLGQQLKKERLNLNKKQNDIVEAARVSIPTVRLLENGQGSLASFWQVLEALGLELTGRNLPPSATTGQSLGLLRKKRGVTQKQLAELVKVTAPTIHALEKRNSGRLETLAKVLQQLGAGAYLAKKGDKKPFYTHAGNSSTDHTWTTPAHVMEKLYQVFGVFDLDPCSPTRTRRGAPVKAKIYYTAEDNGLSLDWCGHVFLNPPYGRYLKVWIAKAYQETKSGRAHSVTALIPARTDTRFWHDHIARRAHVFLLRGRLSFGAGEEAAPFPSALVVWGADNHIIGELKSGFSDAWHIPI
jgi:phage N-6-adenine-methyltransferase